MTTQPTQNPVPSESPRDLKFNAGKIDEFVTSLAEWYVDRFGIKHYTIEGLKNLVLQQIYNLGWNPVGTFQGGATLAAAGDIIQDTSTGVWYRWDNLATLPKVVPAGSTPASSGGIGEGKWLAVDVSDVLRKELAKDSGAGLVGTSGGGTVQSDIDDIGDKLIALDSAEYRSKNLRALTSFQFKLRRKLGVSILLQGDSLTAGYDITSTDTVPPEEGDTARHAKTTYPERLQFILQQATGCPVQTVIRAISGYTSKNAYENSSWQSNPNANIAVLMYAYNDSYNLSHEDYLLYMERLIRRFIDWGMGVVVCTTAAGGNGATDALYQIWGQEIKNLSTIYGCGYLNGDEVQNNIAFGSVQSDLLHFNSMGYQRFGDAVASMIMAGGLLPYYRPVSSEFHMFGFAQSDKHGFFDAVGNIDNAYHVGAYTLQGQKGLMPLGTAGRLTYSFYLDAEAAEVDVIGSWTAGSKVSFILEQGRAGTSDPIAYYNYSYHSSSLFSNYNASQTTTVTGEPNGVSGNTALPKKIGNLVGRGWKTITVITDATSTDVTYIQGLTVRPIPVHQASQTNTSYSKGFVESIAIRLPDPQGAIGSGGIPDPYTLGTIYMPLPYDLHQRVFSAASQPFDSGIAKLKIHSVGGTHGDGYFEAIITKAATGNLFKVTPIFSYPSGAWPTVAAGLGTCANNVAVAANSVATGMPQRNIDTRGAFALGPTPTKHGFWMNIAFDWTGVSGGAKTGYYQISLESPSAGSGATATRGGRP